MANFVHFNSFTFNTIKFFQINFKYQAYFFVVLLYMYNIYNYTCVSVCYIP